MASFKSLDIISDTKSINEYFGLNLNFLNAFHSEDQSNKSKDESSDFLEEWQKNQTGMMEKMMQPWLNNTMFNAKEDEQSPNPTAAKDNKSDEIDVLRQQIDELRDIITKKNT